MQPSIPTPPASEFMTIGEIARSLQLSTTTIWRHVRQGHIKAIKIGRSYRVRREDFDLLLATAVVIPRPSEEQATE